MKRKINLLAAMCLTFLLIGGSVFAQSQKAVEKKIAEMNDKFTKQMLAGEFTTDHYAEDAISMPNNSPMIVGLDAIKANNAQMAQLGVKFDKVEFITKKVLVSGDMATEIGTYDMTMTMPNMPTPINDRGKYVTIWQIQKDGNLKVKVETWNTDMSPAGMD